MKGSAGTRRERRGCASGPVERLARAICRSPRPAACLPETLLSSAKDAKLPTPVATTARTLSSPPPPPSPLPRPRRARGRRRRPPPRRPSPRGNAGVVGAAHNHRQRLRRDCCSGDDRRFVEALAASGCCEFRRRSSAVSRSRATTPSPASPRGPCHSGPADGSSASARAPPLRWPGASASQARGFERTQHLETSRPDAILLPRDNTKAGRAGSKVLLTSECWRASPSTPRLSRRARRREPDEMRAPPASPPSPPPRRPDAVAFVAVTMSAIPTRMTPSPDSTTTAPSRPRLSCPDAHDAPIVRGSVEPRTKPRASGPASEAWRSAKVAVDGGSCRGFRNREARRPTPGRGRRETCRNRWPFVWRILRPGPFRASCAVWPARAAGPA